ncbi:MAG: hypothetical protein L6R39_007548 [Caloplaca ligustica]|nr:MAG: hypothetical protein L6R39_007548 [Caloplaca ligustica]
MITRFLAEVSTVFNPFRKPGRTCRVVLAHLPANARQSMKINTKVLTKDSKEPSMLKLKFKDGKEMQLDTEKLSVKDIMEEVDRHSRLLKRQADLSGN